MGNPKSIKDWKVRLIARITAITLLLIAIFSTIIDQTMSVEKEDINWQVASQHLLFSVDLVSAQENPGKVPAKINQKIDEVLMAMASGTSFTVHKQEILLSEPSEAFEATLTKLSSKWNGFQEALKSNQTAEAKAAFQEFKALCLELDGQIEEAIADQKSLVNILFMILSGISIIVIIALFFVSAKLLFEPLYALHDKTKKLTKGEMDDVQAEESDSEVGKVGRNINILSQTLKHATDFLLEIEKGNLESDINDGFNSQLKDNLLIKNLVRMRDQMKSSAIADQQRRWGTEGLAKFVDILRKDNEGLETLANHILSNLIKYLNANQGAIFIVEDEEAADIKMEMTAMYAYNRKKFIDKKVAAGEGLVGQVYLEAETIYMTDVPSSYVEITSGLGEATPGCILLVPMKVNDKVLGVIELASFAKFEQYQIEFIEKLGENIAATISSAKVNEKTRKLLEESQMMGEQMRAQEEEMRQNMEEMQATQEEMQRSQRELQQTYEQMQKNEVRLAEQEANLNAILNSTSDSIVSVDSNFRVLVVNNEIMKRYAAAGIEISKGDNIFDFIPDEAKAEWKEHYERVLSGEAFDFIHTDTVGDTDEKTYRHYFLNPIYGEDGSIKGGSVLSRDVTAEKRTELQIQNLLEEAQQDAEILKAQEEMMSKQMNEIMEAQDAMEKAKQEVEYKENNLNGIINNTDESIIMIDTDYKVLVMNDVLRARYKGTQYEFMDVGANVLDALDDSVRDEWVDYYERGFMGEILDFTIKSSVKGEDSYRNYRIHPVRNSEGNVYAITVFNRDVTAFKKMELENKRLKN